MNPLPGWKLCLLLAALVSGGSSAAQAQQGRAFTVIERFSFCPTNGGIFLPVKVEGKEYLFLLDTGSSRMVYDKTFRAVLGPAVKRELVKGTTLEGRTNEMFNAPPAFLGKISLQTPEPVSIDDLANFRLLSRLPVYGAIGMSVLGRHYVYLNFDENVVEFMEPGQPDSKPVNEDTPPVPKLPVLLPTGPANCLLDSGGENFGGLAPALFDELARSGKMRVFGTNIMASYERLQLIAKGRLDRVTVLDQEFRDVIFERSEPNRLGYAFITNYNWLLDMRHLQVMPEPRSSLKRKPQPPRSQDK